MGRGWRRARQVSDRRPIPLPVAASRDVLSGASEMAALMRSLDWQRTPLGDPAGWPQSLRTAVDILLSSRYPMFLAWGPELAFLYNDGYRPIFGNKHPAVLGQPFREVWAEIWDDIGPLVERAMTGEATWSEDLLLFMERRGYPEEVYFTFSYSPLRGDDGDIAGMLCVCIETTGKVFGERRLKTLRDLGAKTRDARSAVEVCRVAGKVMAANEADIPFSLIYLSEESGDKARLAAHTGCTWGEIFSPETIEVQPDAPHAWPFSPVLGRGRLVRHGIDPELGLPGTPWPEPCTSAAVLPLAKRGQDAPRGFLIVGISRRQPFEEQYERFLDLLADGVASALANVEAYEVERRRAEALAGLDRAKTAFFSNVSHEFRTPLTLMLGPLHEVLADTAHLTPAAREQLQLAQRNALRMLKLVNSLLDFSRIEAGRVQACYEKTDLARLTAELASNFRSVCEQASLELRVMCPPLPDPVYVDRDMWEKIVLNLVSNAFKFTFEGVIEVELCARGGTVQLAVRDTGVGIPPEELPRVFERFRRVEGSRGRAHDGSGIGLALVQELVKLHGGRLDVESVLGSGTAFTVTVPLGCDHLPQDRIGADRTIARTAVGAEVYAAEAGRWLPEGGVSQAEGGIAPRTAAGTLLLVDDNADMREYLARLLRPRWEVLTASDGVEALEMVRREPPDLVLSDVMMPRLGGFELLEALRADEKTRSIPFIVLSARAGEELRAAGIEAGADDYLVKPFSARELIARVDAQLTLAHGARERAALLQRERMFRREAELQKQHLHSLFMQAPTPVVILRGADHIVELANSYTCEVWGRSHEQVIGRPLLEALPEMRGQLIEQMLDRVYATGEVQTSKEMLAELDRRGDGVREQMHFTLVFAPLRGIDGVTEGVLALGFDVTEQVAAREHMNTLRRDAEAANRAKDEFIAMLSHELRNPLAPILTAIELLRLRAGTQFERERGLIERQARQLIALVDDLLDVSRIARGMIVLRKVPVEAAEVVRHAIETVSPLLEQRAHRLTVDVPDAGLMVLGDAARLTQVFSNLLSNAAKYTDPGGSIEIRAARAGDVLELTVADNGTGISEDLLPQIFEMFTQARQPIDRSVGGLGLGLTIVRSLVDLHGGTIAAHSDGRGRGSRFTVRLPAAATAVTLALPAPARRELGAGRRRRILVVDDNVDAAEMLAEYLEERGHTIHVAHDGPSALRASETFMPDVALLDIGLPGMDGYELAARLQESRGSGTLSLISITGYARAVERERTARAGFAAHLVKPINLDELAALIETAAAFDSKLEPKQVRT